MFTSLLPAGALVLPCCALGFKLQTHREDHFLHATAFRNKMKGLQRDSIDGIVDVIMSDEQLFNHIVSVVIKRLPPESRFDPNWCRRVIDYTIEQALDDVNVKDLISDIKRQVKKSKRKQPDSQGHRNKREDSVAGPATDVFKPAFSSSEPQAVSMSSPHRVVKNMNRKMGSAAAQERLRRNQQYSAQHQTQDKRVSPSERSGRSNRNDHSSTAASTATVDSEASTVQLARPSSNLNTQDSSSTFQDIRLASSISSNVFEEDDVFAEGDGEVGRGSEGSRRRLVDRPSSNSGTGGGIGTGSVFNETITDPTLLQTALRKGDAMEAKQQQHPRDASPRRDAVDLDTSAQESREDQDGSQDEDDDDDELANWEQQVLRNLQKHEGEDDYGIVRLPSTSPGPSPSHGFMQFPSREEAVQTEEGAATENSSAEILTAAPEEGTKFFSDGAAVDVGSEQGRSFDCEAEFRAQGPDQGSNQGSAQQGEGGAEAEAEEVNDSSHTDGDAVELADSDAAVAHRGDRDDAEGGINHSKPVQQDSTQNGVESGVVNSGCDAAASARQADDSDSSDDEDDDDDDDDYLHNGNPRSPSSPAGQLLYFDQAKFDADVDFYSAAGNAASGDGDGDENEEGIAELKPIKKKRKTAKKAGDGEGGAEEKRHVHFAEEIVSEVRFRERVSYTEREEMFYSHAEETQFMRQQGIETQRADALGMSWIDYMESRTEEQAALEDDSAAAYLDDPYGFGGGHTGDFEDEDSYGEEEFRYTGDFEEDDDDDDGSGGGSGKAAAGATGAGGGLFKGGTTKKKGGVEVVFTDELSVPSYHTDADDDLYDF